jgi:hypothetical protein
VEQRRSPSKGSGEPLPSLTPTWKRFQSEAMLDAERRHQNGERAASASAQRRLAASSGRREHVDDEVDQLDHSIR